MLEQVNKLVKPDSGVSYPNLHLMCAKVPGLLDLKHGTSMPSNSHFDACEESPVNSLPGQSSSKTK